MDARPDERPRDDTRWERSLGGQEVRPPGPRRGEPRPPREDEEVAGPPLSVADEVMQVHRGPGTIEVTEDEIAERMDAESPDGRPPPMRDRREAQIFFWVAFAIVPTAVIGLLAWYAGWLPALLALLLMLGFIGFAAWPTWHAALNRKQDTERVKREVVSEHLPRNEHPQGPGVP